MKRQLKKNEKVQAGLLSLACVIIVLGILFLVNAMQEDPVPFEQLNPVDAVMRMDRIYEGFMACFGDGGLMWAVLAVMLVLSLVFITFPLLTGILAVKNEQTLGFKKEGFPFGVITLPVVEKMRAAQAEQDGVLPDAAAEAAEEEAAG